MKNLTQTIAELARLDAERTQGDWQGSSSCKAHEYDVVLMEDTSIVICSDTHKHNRNYIAAAPQMMEVIRELVKQRDMAVEGLRRITTGEYPNPRDNRPMGCHHGRFYHETCEECIDAFCEQTLATIEGGKTE
jgi:hypothetical protein